MSDHAWSIDDAERTYAVETWGDGFFHVNANGNVAVRPLDDSDLSIDIAEVLEEARGENVSLPLLIRFQDVLRARVRRLNLAFRSAIEEAGYPGIYRTIYPIKVNQLQEVVAEVMDAGAEFQLGLECGSKSELIATLPLVSDQQLLLCNGVKDRTMLSLMVQAQKLGQNVLPVIEKYSEFEHLLTLGEQYGITPRMGVRVKLSTRGAGRWFASGGVGSKFGLTMPEVVRLVEVLEGRGAGDSLELLHFHLGSQISDIQVLRRAVREIAQIYADLRDRGLPIQFLDVGGGLGVNYGADYGDGESSVNYGLAEYANAVVYAVMEICDERAVPAPTLLSESGRALTAHHSMLVIPVIGVHRPDSPPVSEGEGEPHSIVARMQAAWDELGDAVSAEALLEIYHDVQEGRHQADQLARLGYLDLQGLAAVDSLYWRVCRAILSRLQALDLSNVPPEQAQLEEQLTDLYLCDFSVFHSILDHWSIDQIFPVMPISRLQEKPERRGVIVDLTCDSDGKIARYVCDQPVPNSWLPMHEYHPGTPYYVGVFLVGAYQEILGDSHNLFGRVSEIHVYANPEESGNFWIEEKIPGITVREMLAQVQYFPNDLDRRMTELVKRKIDAGAIKPNEGMRFLNFYTSLFDQTTYCDA